MSKEPLYDQLQSAKSDLRGSKAELAAGTREARALGVTREARALVGTREARACAFAGFNEHPLVNFKKNFNEKYLL